MLCEKMRPIYKKLLLSAFVAIASLGVILVWITTNIDWHEESSILSPDRSLRAFLMRSGSEAGEAPYGDHVVLVPSWMILGQYFRPSIFAGYCNGGVRYNWTSRDTLCIKCDGAKIMKRLSKYGSINIEYGCR
jgi:hypothetical protein